MSECQADADCAEIDPSALCVSLECVVPECSTEGVSDERDLLEESCIGHLCAPRPCQEQLFLLIPSALAMRAFTSQATLTYNSDGQWPETVEAGGWPMAQLPDGRYYLRQEILNGSYA